MRRYSTNSTPSKLPAFWMSAQDTLTLAGFGGSSLGQLWTITKPLASMVSARLMISRTYKATSPTDPVR
ncbi:hypothetical protein TSH7_04660 [Azospirillum sp. TSH7]|nr:hypothetical protein TSH20_24725 [Azospirillum sp. TSH20]PWC67291.1 hypothetical protein TSH7_04660 [Azospirillum sp. TSH7]